MGISNAVQAPQSSRSDPIFTQRLIEAMGPIVNSRNRVVLGRFHQTHPGPRQPDPKQLEASSAPKRRESSGPGFTATIRQSTLCPKKVSHGIFCRRWIANPCVWHISTSREIISSSQPNWGIGPNNCYQVTHEDFKCCTTQLYPKDDPCLATNIVFAVKDVLVVDFKPLEGDFNVELELEYNVILAPKDYKSKVF